jgi:cytochrome c-type biogenesis protein CcmE
MVLKARHRRFAWIATGILLLGAAAALVLNAFRSNLVFFYTPTQVYSNEALKFKVTDNAKAIPVVYQGILPDLFKEGKGVVAQGALGADGVFNASQVLAKHDENYMPPEAEEALRKAGHPVKPPEAFVDKARASVQQK